MLVFISPGILSPSCHQKVGKKTLDQGGAPDHDQRLSINMRTFLARGLVSAVLPQTLRNYFSRPQCRDLTHSHNYFGPWLVGMAACLSSQILRLRVCVCV